MVEGRRRELAGLVVLPPPSSSRCVLSSSRLPPTDLESWTRFDDNKHITQQVTNEDPPRSREIAQTEPSTPSPHHACSTRLPSTHHARRERRRHVNENVVNIAALCLFDEIAVNASCLFDENAIDMSTSTQLVRERVAITSSTRDDR
jgi:hypothetical protein